jgi:lysyl-tRNA synthetase, class II
VFSGLLEKKDDKGQISLMGSDFMLVKKCLFDFEGLLSKDKSRYENRYLDFVINPKSREILKVHSKINKSIRKYLWSKDFEEYHTPALSTKYNGGTSSPFECDIKAMNKKGYLRVSSETYLKQIIAAGIPAVFEINSQFRNEGMNENYMQEFTLLEMYKSFSSTKDMLKSIVKMIEDVLIDLNGRPVIKAKDDKIINVSVNDWKIVDAYKFFKDKYDIDITGDKSEIIEKSKSLGVNTSADSYLSTVVGNLIDKFIRKEYDSPLIIINLPYGMTPLMKRSETDGRFADRCWLFLNRVDFCDIGSSQDDYFSQYEILSKQNDERKKTKNQDLNIDALNTVAFGLPPTSEAGLSITRFIKAITNAPKISETSLFPLV